MTRFWARAFIRMVIVTGAFSSAPGLYCLHCWCFNALLAPVFESLPLHFISLCKSPLEIERRALTSFSVYFQAPLFWFRESK